MKITSIYTRMMGTKGRNWIFVFIETDEGITGIGEATTEYQEHAVVAAIEHHFAPLLVGKNPTEIERIWQMMYRLNWWRQGIVMTSAMSGIDQALWDITGKAYGQPVYKLLGGPCRDRVRLYARADLGLPTDAEEAQAAVAEGFSAFKWGYGPTGRPFDEAENIQRSHDTARAIVEATGNKLELIVDCAGLFSLNGAMRLIRGLQSYPMMFIEEPVCVDNLNEMECLHRARWASIWLWVSGSARAGLFVNIWNGAHWMSSSPIFAMLEELVSYTNSARWLRYMGYALLHTTRMGRFPRPRLSTSLLAMSNFLILEYCRFSPLFLAVQKQGLRIVNGYAELPTAPGLGVELDMELINKHPYQALPIRQYYEVDGAVPLI